MGYADRGAAQLVVGDPPVVEDQREPIGVLACARVELLPEITVAPIVLRVVALGLRLVGQRRPGHSPLLRTFS
jgi:hypothetical protein